MQPALLAEFGNGLASSDMGPAIPHGKSAQESGRLAREGGVPGKPPVQIIDRGHRLDPELALVLVFQVAGDAGEDAEGLRFGRFVDRDDLEKVGEGAVPLAQDAPGLGGDLGDEPHAALF